MRKLAGFVLVILILVLASGVESQLQAATVATLDGQIIVGPAVVFTAGTPASGGGSVTIADRIIALADCDWIEPGDGAGIVVPAGQYINVWLGDGSWLPATRMEVGTGESQLALDGPLGPLQVPLAGLRGWSLGAELPMPSEATADQVQLDSGVNQMHVNGLDGDKLKLSTEDGSKDVLVPIDQVKALRLAGAARPKTAPGAVRLVMSVSDQHAGLRLLVVGSGPAPTALHLAGVPSVVIGAAVLHARLRTEGGRRVYLSALDPVEVKEVGAFDVKWPWTRDTDLSGAPLVLGGIRYEHGIVVHSQAMLRWHLAHGYTRLRALAGIADVVADQGDCAASLIGDGTTLWHRDSVKGGEKPLPIDLDLSKVDDLELHVDYGARYDIGDHFVLADSYLVKAAAGPTK